MDYNLSNKKNEAISWLTKYGGKYKNQSISVTGKDGSVIKGQLDWSESSEFMAKGISYLQVPFVFPTVGKNLPTTNEGAYTNLNIVLREKEDGFEGALQVTLLRTKMVDNKGRHTTNALQTYYNLKGVPLNAYIRSEEKEAIKSVSIAPAKVGRVSYPIFELKKEVNHGLMMLEQNTDRDDYLCYEVTYTTVVDGPIEVDEEYNSTATVYVIEEQVLICSTVPGVPPPVPSNGGGGGGNAQGGSDDGDFPPNIPPELNPLPVETPCTKGAKIAKIADSILSQPGVKKVFDQLTDIDSTEKGFMLYKHMKYESDANDAKLIVDSLFAGDIQTGTDENIAVTGNNNKGFDKLFGFLHTHPSTGYTAPSLKDFYSLLESQIGNPEHVINFVKAYDGSVYAISVTDSTQAKAKFEEFKASIDFEKNQFKEGSDNLKLFTQLNSYFSRNEEENKNISFENVLAAMINNYGISMVKQDASGKFKTLLNTPNLKRKNNGKVKIKEVIKGC